MKVAHLHTASSNIAVANNNPGWQQIKASFALEGIELTDDDSEIVGRFLSGEITFEEGIAEIHAALQVTESKRNIALVRG